MASPYYLVCVASPSDELALTNCIYVNPVDARSPYVNLGNFTFRCQPLQEIPVGHVALNAIHRRQARIFVGSSVELWDFFIPVSREFSIKAVTIEACSRQILPKVAPDLACLASNIRTNFAGHVLHFGQSILMRYGEADILLWVKSDVRGLLTERTELMVEWRDSIV
jgi:vesicle-fusing ATPase